VNEPDALVEAYFQEIMKEHPLEKYDNTAYWAMVAAREYMRKDDSKTMQEILVRMKRLKRLILNSPVSTPGVSCGFEILLTYMTREPEFLEEARTLEDLRTVIINFMTDIMDYMSTSPEVIATNMIEMFGHEDTVILTRNWSLAVLAVCRMCLKMKKNIAKVLVMGDDSSRMVDALTADGVNAVAVKDSSMAYYLEEANMVVLGCDSVCDSGSAFVPVGTLPMVLIANHLNKEVYILAELYKFSNLSVDSTHEYAEVADREFGCPEKSVNCEVLPKRSITRVFTDFCSIPPSVFKYCRTNINN